MIGYLRGLVVERRSLGESAVEVVVDVGGVGYRVLVPPRVASSAVNGDSELTLFVHTHVREGAITLYGFAGRDDRQAFELLISTHGVGPGLALAILSVHGPRRLAEIVSAGEVEPLTLVPGVGRKTAVRLLMELKARLDQLDGGLVTAALGTEPEASAASDVASALAQLGYGADEVREVLRELSGQGSAEEMLRQALKSLGARR